jgi:glycosyltransferase involved in cell wall biosynthesis
MVSVLITTFNSAQFIETCLDSVQHQSYQPLEIIIVDNASTDGTRELLAKRGTGIKVVYNDSNIGFAAAQNQAARSAKAVGFYRSTLTSFSVRISLGKRFRWENPYRAFQQGSALSAIHQQLWKLGETACGAE